MKLILLLAFIGLLDKALATPTNQQAVIREQLDEDHVEDIDHLKYKTKDSAAAEAGGKGRLYLGVERDDLGSRAAATSAVGAGRGGGGGRLRGDGSGGRWRDRDDRDRDEGRRSYDRDDRDRDMDRDSDRGGRRREYDDDQPRGGGGRRGGGSAADDASVARAATAGNRMEALTKQIDKTIYDRAHEDVARYAQSADVDFEKDSLHKADKTTHKKEEVYKQ